MPDTGKSPLDKKQETIIHVQPPQVLQKELIKDSNTVHPLESEKAPFKDVNTSYEPQPIVKSGAKFIKRINVVAYLFFLYICYVGATSFLDFIGMFTVGSAIFYMEYKYWSSVSRSGGSFSLKSFLNFFDFEMSIMLLFIIICTLTFTFI